MTDSPRRTPRVAAVVALVAALGASGCADGVQLEGKIFEMTGLTGSLGKRAEPKTDPRAPLVLPPPSQQLPEPGALAAAAPAPSADPAWPKDPDRTKAENDAALQKAQAEYCSNGNWKEKAMGQEEKARQGPAGPCTGSLFSVLGKSLFGD